ncbi:MAG: hypothetical protein ACR2QF_15140 [Geminicoccaceae bacterium]
MTVFPRMDEWLFDTIDYWLAEQVSNASVQIWDGRIGFYVTTPNEGETFEKSIDSIESLVRTHFDHEEAAALEALSADLRAAAALIDKRLAAGPPTRRQELERQQAYAENRIKHFTDEAGKIKRELADL